MKGLAGSGNSNSAVFGYELLHQFVARGFHMATKKKTTKILARKPLILQQDNRASLNVHFALTIIDLFDECL